MARDDAIVLEVEGHEVRVSNPQKLYFPKAGYTKLDLVKYYLAVAPAALRAISNRPLVLVRYVDGADGKGFFQKRAPQHPDWMKTVQLSFPSGRTADELVLTHAAELAWITNLGNIDLNPHPVRADDLDHPDELRVDLDPGPGVDWEQIRQVAMVVKGVLDDHGLIGWPKTSGSRGMHVYVRIERRWGFDDVRRAALALAREVERRAPELATSAWWKEERHGVFIDYNQNAKDRTIAAAWSVRPKPDARVSMPLAWEDVPTCDPAAFTLATVPGLLERFGDPAAGMDEAVCSLEQLLALSERQAAAGQGDAPWPPHYAKGADEPPRAPPSKRRKPAAEAKGEASGEGAGEGSGKGGRRKSKFPLLVISHAKDKENALAGLERWKAKYPKAANHLAVDDVLVDAMRGRYTAWWRVRVNLRHVPEGERPAQEKPDPDYDPVVEWGVEPGKEPPWKSSKEGE